MQTDDNQSPQILPNLAELRQATASEPAPGEARQVNENIVAVLRFAGVAMRVILSFPFVLIGMPVAAWCDARNFDHPELFPARSRLVYYMGDWWWRVVTGDFLPRDCELVFKGERIARSLRATSGASAHIEPSLTAELKDAGKAAS